MNRRADVQHPWYRFRYTLSYYQSQLPVASSAGSGTTAASATPSATANDLPPWENTTPPAQQARDAQVLGITNFVDTSNVPQLHSSAADAKTEEDNQNLFALYNAVNNVSYLASMATRSTMTAGQLVGLNTRFQTGLQQIQSFISNTTFNNFTLQAAAPSSSVTSTAQVPNPTFGYTGGTIVSDANVANALLESCQRQFFDRRHQRRATTNVPIDLSQVQGTLSADNIVSYVNQQLMAAGFSSRFQRVITQGSINDPTTASYGIEINTSPSESISLSSTAATPALYVAGTSGLTSSTSDTTADNQGRLIKLSDLSNPQAVFNTTAAPSSGTTTAQSTVVELQRQCLYGR